MNKYLLARPVSITLMCFLSFMHTSQASNDGLPALKKMGFSLDLYRQKLDLKVTDIKINADVPGITPELIDAFKPQLNTSNNIDVYGIRLDYQLTPSFNIFGSLGKVEESTIVDFSTINAALSDLVIEQKGTVYSVGGTYTKHFDPLFASMSVVHSRIDLNDNPHDIKVSGLIPSVGIKTRMGILTGSLLYQEVDAVFAGKITAPFIGAVPVEVNATNDNDIQVLAGLRTRLARDFYLNASAGLNGQEHYQIQLNKRF